MATKKEFATLYLAMKGINTSGNTVDKMVKETAQEELAQNLITTLRKVKAQLELAKTAGLLSDDEAKTIKSLSEDNNADEYDKIKKAIITSIKKGLKNAKMKDELFSDSTNKEMKKVFKRGEQNND